jgi:hypothetical protein
MHLMTDMISGVPNTEDAENPKLCGVGAGAEGVGDLVPGVAVGACVVDELREEAFGLVDGVLVVDPGGNWIRIVPTVREREPAPTRLARALDSAVTLAGSHGAERQALRILEGALAREVHASEEERTSALEFREELLERLGCTADARTALTAGRVVMLFA